MTAHESAPGGGYGTTGSLLGAGTAGAATVAVLTLLSIELYPSSNLAPIMAFFAAPVSAFAASLLGGWIGTTKATLLPRVLSMVMLFLGSLVTIIFLIRDARLPENSRGTSLVSCLVPLVGAAGLVVEWRKRKDGESPGKGPE